ncbi:MAG: hypothetical protein P8X74_16910 [Reinekea sp.]
MDRVYCNPYNIDHYYNYSQTHQEDSQHAFQPEAGQTSAGVPASGASWSEASWSHQALGQPYQNPNSPAQIPSSPGPDLEYLLRTPQPITLEETILPEAEQTFAGVPASGVSWSHQAQSQPYLNFNLPAQIPSSLGPDLEYLRHPSQPIAVGEIIPNEVPPEPLNPQPAVEAPPPRLSIKERFLAGLDNYAQGVQLKDCSATLRFSNYIDRNGHLVDRGISLYDQLTPAEKTRLNQAIIARQGVKLDRIADEETVAERFLAGLDRYAQGAKLVDCSATLLYSNYASDEGYLHKAGRNLRFGLLPEDQERVDQALLSRRNIYNQWLATDRTVSKRFLASLNDYARGVPVSRCAKNIRLNLYVTDDGHLQEGRGQSLYNKLSQDDKVRVNQALTARKEVIAQHTSAEVAKFMDALKPYGNGQSLWKCGSLSGLKKKAITYFTSEGGLKLKGKLLVEKLQPSQRDEVFKAIAKRQQGAELNPQWPVMLPPVPETGGMDPTAMADPMQTEAMWASVWQLTGQAAPGPTESAEPPIPYYDREAVGADFQHQYGPTD